MYNFLISEAWWMETIINTLISGIFTIIVAVIIYNSCLKGIKYDTENLGRGQKDLKSEHKDLSNEYDELSKENRDLSKEVAVKVDGIRELIVLEQNEQKHRHDSLSGNQKVMVDSINNLQTFAKEMEKLQVENLSLKNENQRLRQQLKQQQFTKEDDWEPEI